MNPRLDFKELKYSIADLLFGKELDEAYEMGIRVGAEFATRKLSFEVNLKRNLKLTKVEERGYGYAIEAIDRVKPEIERTTGATL
jgi:hypothetical protein